MLLELSRNVLYEGQRIKFRRRMGKTAVRIPRPPGFRPGKRRTDDHRVPRTCERANTRDCLVFVPIKYENIHPLTASTCTESLECTLGGGTVPASTSANRSATEDQSKRVTSSAAARS